jgi:hypothetical protein
MTLAFFRKHRKWFMILMVLAVVSMMFFQSWQYLPLVRDWIFGTSSGPVAGAIKGKTVTMSQLSEFSRKLLLASEATEFWLRGLAPRVATQEQQVTLVMNTARVTALQLTMSVLAKERISTKEALCWMAIYEEARALGFDVSEAQVNDRLKKLESLGLTPQLVSQFVSARADGRRQTLIEGLQIDMTLRAYIDWVADTMGTVVAPQLKSEFAKTDDRLQARLAILKAETYVLDVKDVPEKDLKEQFDKFKQYLPGAGPEGYGYRIPDKVALEYLEADPKGFEAQAQAKITEADIKVYYEANKNTEFLESDRAEKKTDATTPAAAPPAKEGAAAPVAPEKAAPAAPEKAAPKLQTPAGAKGDAGIEGPTAPALAPVAPAAPLPAAPIPAVALPAASVPAAALPAAPAPAAATVAPKAEPKVKPLAEVQAEIRKTLVRQEAARLALQNLNDVAAEIRKLKTAPGLDIYADGSRVRYMALKGFMSEQELGEAPSLGMGKRGNALLKTDALSIRELIGDKAKLAVGEISDPYTGPEGEAYIFRVTAVKENHEPPALDEVRKQVLEDVKLIRAFEIAREKAKKIVAEAAAKGLEQAAKDEGATSEVTDWFPQIQVRIPYGNQIFELLPDLPGVGRDRVVVSECFRMAAEGKKLSDVVLAQRNMAVVIELVGEKAPRKAVYESEKAKLLQTLTIQIGSDAFRAALAADAVTTRDGVTLAENGPPEFSLPRNLRQGYQGGGGDDGGDF